IHWQFGAGGEIVLSSYHTCRAQSPPALGPGDLGRWVHLAITCDDRAKVMIHYVDGKPIGRHEFAVRHPLCIGAAQIGNWAPVQTPGIPIRSLHGRIDEFGIFGRALSGEEIRTMYELGKPTP